MTTGKKLKTVFFGTPDFSVPTLELLANHPSIHIVRIVTMPDRPADRGQELKAPPVALFAKEQRLPLLQTENVNKEEEFLLEIEREEVDLVVVLAFAQFLKQRLLDIPKLGCFNIHTSRLPKYRGAAPIQHAILNGDSSTGVSIQKMVLKMDAGDVVLDHAVDIASNETGGQLYTRLKFEAALACNSFLSQLLEGTLVATAQDESHVSFAPTLKKEDGLLHFSEQTTEQILNRIRGLSPWPGTFCYLNTKRLKVIDASLYSARLSPGETDVRFGVLLVGCLNGTLRLHQVQLEGKKACSDVELMRGIRETIRLHS